ncbi:MAG: hypothetical protein ACP5QX_06650, partial [Caldisericaceae bacterium]
YSITSDSLPVEMVGALNNLVNSNYWNRTWGRAVSDLIIFGRAFIRPYIEENDDLSLIVFPPESITTTNNMTLELLKFDSSIFSSSGYSRVTYSSDRIYESVNGNVVLDVPNDLGFVPVVFLRAPGAGSNPDYPVPITAPAISLSILATMYSNDVTVLAHLQSFSTFVISGAESEEITLSPSHVISLSDANASADWKTPQSKISDIDSLIDKLLYRAAVMCGVPPDVFRYDVNIANSAAGSVATRFMSLRNISQRVRDEVTDGMRKAIAMLVAMKYGIQLRQAESMFTFDARYETDVSAQITIQDVEAWNRAVQYNLIDFESARRYFNPTETQEKTAAAADEYARKYRNPEGIMNYQGTVGVY